MSRLNKILLVAFSLLMLLTVGEITYYFTFVSQRPTVENNMQQSNSTTQNTTSNPSQAALDALPRAISENTISNLRELRREFMQSVSLTNEYKGTVIAIDTTPGSFSNPAYPGTYQYVLSLTIQSETSTFKNRFYYDEESFKKIQVLKNNEKLDINNVKVGDTVIVKETLDLLDQKSTDNRVAVTITVL